jgi:hypothetical protein
LLAEKGVEVGEEGFMEADILWNEVLLLDDC